MVFGLKLNYSVKLIQDKSQMDIKKINIIPRLEKKWFKFAKDLSKDFFGSLDS